MPIRHLILTVAAGLIATFAVAASAMAADATKNLVLKIGQNNGELEPLWRASGVFDGAPYKIEFSSFNNALDNYTALAAGNVDVSDSSVNTALQLQQAAPEPWIAKTAPIKGIIVRDGNFPGTVDRYVVLAGSKSGVETLTAETLKGKKFAYSPGANNYLVYLAALHHFNVKPTELQPIVLDTTANSLALLNNSVDLVSGSLDLYGAAVENGAHVVSSSTKLDVPILSGIFANSKALNDPVKGPAIEDFVKRYIAFQDWFTSHPQEAQDAFVNGRQFRPSQAKAAWLSGRVALKPIGPDVVADTQKVNGLLYASGDFKKQLDASVVFDDRFTDLIKQALVDAKYDEHLAQSVKNATN